MTLRMLDSIYPANLPAGADAYAGYVDGHWANYAAVKAQHPAAHVLSIAVFPQNDADCLDVENGDATPAQAPAWVRRQWARGVRRPVLYASVSVIPAVLHALNGAGIGWGSVRLWSAHYTGRHICGPSTCAWPGVPACDGTQWTDTAPGNGGSEIDESLLAGDFFGGNVSATGPEHWDDADWRAFFGHGYNARGWSFGGTLQDLQTTVVPQVAALGPAVAALAAKAGGEVDEAALAAALAPVIRSVIEAEGIDPDAIAARVAAVLGGKLSAT